MIYDYIIEKPPLNEDTLAHYGVKGMKWRHRKGRKSTVRKARNRGKKNPYGFTDESIDNFFAWGRDMNDKIHNKLTEIKKEYHKAEEAQAKDEEHPKEPRYAYDPDTGEVLYTWDYDNDTWAPIKKVKKGKK